MREARYGAVSTKDQLIAKAGRPKDDISFGFLGTKKMSTGYKAVLGGLKDYHQIFNSDSNQKAVGQPRVDAMMEQIDRVGTAAQRYMQAKGHSHKAEIAEIQTQVANEKQVLKGLKDEVDKGVKLPGNMELWDIVAFAREGIALKDIAALHAEGLSPQDAREGSRIANRARS
jgi:hypothetical protein